MRFLFILSLLFFSASCRSSDEKDVVSIEAQILECMEATFQKNESNLSVALENLEDTLIKNGLLESSSGESYYNLLLMVQGLEKVPLSWNESLKKISDNLYESFNSECLEKIKTNNSTSYKESKFNQLEEEFDKIQELNNFNILEIYTSVLTTKDCEKPLYKAIILLMFVDISSPGIPVDVPDN